MRAVEPEGLEAFCRLIVPELQDRGAFKTAYSPDAVREKLFPGRTGVVLPTHPAAIARQGR